MKKERVAARFRTNLSVIAIVLYTLFCLTVMLLDGNIQKQLTEQFNEQQIKTVAGLLAEKMNMSLDYSVDHAIGYAELLGSQEAEPSLLYQEIEQMASNDPDIGVGLIAADGTVYGSEGETRDLEKYGYIDQAMELWKGYMTEPYRSCITGDYILTVFQPIDRGGIHIAMLYMSFPLRDIQVQANTTALENEAGIYLLNLDSGNYMSCVQWLDMMPGSWNNLKLFSFSDGYSYEKVIHDLNANEEGVTSCVIDESTYMVAYERITHMNDWYMVVQIDSALLVDTSMQSRRYELISLALLVLATLLLALFLIRKESQEKKKLQQLSTYDTLTDLYNRRAFERSLLAYLTKNETQAKGTLIFFDLDDFKHVNDTYGHKCGDRVLQKFAAILKDNFKNDSILGRFGGDEFIAFLKGQTNEVQIRRQFAKMQYQAKNSIIDEAEAFRIGFSAGIAIYPEDADTLPDLYNRADEALYRVKQSEKGRYERWTDEINH